jgi:hypothetical protein
MPITHFITIDGHDVSPWVMQADIDLVIPGSYTEYTQQADLTLSNVGGKFDGSVSVIGQTSTGVKNVFDTDPRTTPLSKVMIVLISIEYPGPSVYSVIAFTGIAQNVDYGFSTCKIHAGTSDALANSYLKQDIFDHKGQPSSAPLEKVWEQFGLQVGEFNAPQGMEKREWGFLRDLSGKSISYYAAENDGQEFFLNENNQVMYTTPGIRGMNAPYTGRMKAPAQSESAIGLCTKVTVRGGSEYDPAHPGASNAPSKAIFYTTTVPDIETLLNNENGAGGADAAAKMIANYGIIEAPTFYFPDCATVEQCRNRALRLLARYLTYWNRSMPAVVGRTPKLKSGVSYQFQRQMRVKNPGEAQKLAWALGPEMKGFVTRCKTNYSAKSGWVSYIEVAPFAINAANSAQIYATLSPEVA